MRYRLALIASISLMAAMAMAQTSPPAPSNQSDSWKAHPAVAGSSSYRSQSSAEAPARSHFKFRERGQGGALNPLNQPPPSANDKAAVMGKDRAWQNGRPPVDCAQTPMDSACH